MITNQNLTLHSQLSDISTKEKVEGVYPSKSGFTYSVYRETSEVSEQAVDLVEQLKSNVQVLEDLYGRLSFMMREIQGLTKRL